MGSIPGKPLEQFERRLKLLLLVSRKLPRDGRGEPVLSRGPALLNPLQAFGRERHQNLPPVARVRCATQSSRTSSYTAESNSRRNESHGSRMLSFGCVGKVFSLHVGQEIPVGRRG